MLSKLEFWQARPLFLLTHDPLLGSNNEFKTFWLKFFAITQNVKLWWMRLIIFQIILFVTTILFFILTPPPYSWWHSSPSGPGTTQSSEVSPQSSCCCSSWCTPLMAPCYTLCSASAEEPAWWPGSRSCEGWYHSTLEEHQQQCQ